MVVPAAAEEDTQDRNDWILKTRKRREPPKPEALKLRRSEMHQPNLRSLLAEEIEVRTITEQAIFEIKYLYEITTEEELITAGKNQIWEIQPSALKTIKNVPEGTRTPVISFMKLTLTT